MRLVELLHPDPVGEARGQKPARRLAVRPCTRDAAQGAEVVGGTLLEVVADDTRPRRLDPPQLLVRRLDALQILVRRRIAEQSLQPIDRALRLLPLRTPDDHPPHPTAQRLGGTGQTRQRPTDPLRRLTNLQQHPIRSLHAVQSSKQRSGISNPQIHIGGDMRTRHGSISNPPRRIHSPLSTLGPDPRHLLQLLRRRLQQISDGLVTGLFQLRDRKPSPSHIPKALNGDSPQPPQHSNRMRLLIGIPHSLMPPLIPLMHLTDRRLSIRSSMQHSLHTRRVGERLPSRHQNRPLSAVAAAAPA